VRVLKLGGRFFAPAEQTTSRQDGWLMVQLEDAQLLEFISKGATVLADEVGARSVMVRAIRSGKFHHLLAGWLVEVNEPWSPAIAEKNAEYFANLSDAESKQEMTTAFVGLLLGFFQIAAPSSTPSPIVSTGTPRKPRHTRKRAAPSIVTPGEAGPTAPGGSQTATATA
jgi:hypothetical protein